MPDCMPAAIYIGGKLSKKKLEELRDILPPVGDLDEAIRKREAFYGEDGDAAWGKLEELETFCRKNKLTYRRTSNAKYEWDGEVVFWEPGLKEPLSNRCTQEGNSYATYERLKLLLKSGGTLRDIVDDLSRFEKRIPPLELKAKKK